MTKFPRCSDCGGQVRLLKKRGRTREYIKGIFLPVPYYFEIPTCIECDQEFMALEFSKPIDEYLKQRFFK